MILYEIVGETEDSPIYRAMAADNGGRLHRFLESTVEASLATGRLHLSQTVIKAFNHHAIACLHSHAGEYRPCDVTAGDYQPPRHYRVPALMDDFVDDVNRNWEGVAPVDLAAYVLWRLNHIHPFINGNGRTARAACYFVLCLKSEGWLAGDPDILPVLLERHRDAYVEALRLADGGDDLAALRGLIRELLQAQLGGGADGLERDP